MGEKESVIEIVCENCGSVWAKTFESDAEDIDILASLKKCPLCYRGDCG